MARTRAEGEAGGVRAGASAVEQPGAGTAAGQRHRPAERFLQRRVDEIPKTFAGEPAWSRPAGPAAPRNANASLLHLFPAGLLNQLTGACSQAGLQLVRVLPSAAALGGLLENALPLDKAGVALLAAETGPATTGGDRPPGRPRLLGPAAGRHRGPTPGGGGRGVDAHDWVRRAAGRRDGGQRLALRRGCGGTGGRAPTAAQAPRQSQPAGGHTVLLGGAGGPIPGAGRRQPDPQP